MNQQSPTQPRTATRRSFLKTSAALGAAITLPSFAMRAAANKNSAVRMLHIGVGGIGGMQRGQLRNHKKVEFAFLCDVDSNPLNKIGREFPKAQKFSDYRKVFEKHLNEFDAVIVDTPDHHHAPMMTRAPSLRGNAGRPSPLAPRGPDEFARGLGASRGIGAI